MTTPDNNQSQPNNKPPSPKINTKVIINSQGKGLTGSQDLLAKEAGANGDRKIEALDNNKPTPSDNTSSGPTSSPSVPNTSRPEDTQSRPSPMASQAGPNQTVPARAFGQTRPDSLQGGQDQSWRQYSGSPAPAHIQPVSGHGEHQQQFARQLSRGPYPPPQGLYPQAQGQYPQAQGPYQNTQWPQHEAPPFAPGGPYPFQQQFMPPYSQYGHYGYGMGQALPAPTPIVSPYQMDPAEAGSKPTKGKKKGKIIPQPEPSSSESEQSDSSMEDTDSYEIVDLKPPYKGVQTAAKMIGLSRRLMDPKFIKDLNIKVTTAYLGLVKMQTNRIVIVRTQVDPLQNGFNPVPIKVTRPEAAEALVAFMVGRILRDPCQKCLKKNGKFVYCVYVPDHFGHSCANCHYGAEGKGCDLQNQTKFIKWNEVYQPKKEKAMPKDITTSPKSIPTPWKGLAVPTSTPTPKGPRSASTKADPSPQKATSVLIHNKPTVPRNPVMASMIDSFGHQVPRTRAQPIRQNMYTAPPIVIKSFQEVISMDNKSLRSWFGQVQDQIEDTMELATDKCMELSKVMQSLSSQFNMVVDVGMAFNAEEGLADGDEEEAEGPVDNTNMAEGQSKEDEDPEDTDDREFVAADDAEVSANTSSSSDPPFVEKVKTQSATKRSRDKHLIQSELGNIRKKKVKTAANNLGRTNITVPAKGTPKKRKFFKERKHRPNNHQYLF
ncbi:uncharacterized protein BDR25DRAFT_319560 [Lindgomyces ingoldianus]|uniref:Uncharacterized protein n=1 Tax=Lindgomyces ingoldianus TaxID=673940 RepID=A0ACB6QBI6_9PLEO|nr:uncharacterized protein BDR25DRAFT_319560 [Lindgomyces ingoldianus]KAF2463958.1 hypothetical protein BDR25DRAFT_319560 [Lindgomyces ingoldianus]